MSYCKYKRVRVLTDGWWFGLLIMHWSQSTKLLYAGPGLVLVWERAGKPSLYVTSHRGQLNLYG